MFYRLETTKPFGFDEAVAFLLNDKRADWTKCEAVALVQHLLDEKAEELNLGELRRDWLAFRTAKDALRHFEGATCIDNDHAKEWLYELSQIALIIEHDGGVLVCPWRNAKD